MPRMRTDRSWRRRVVRHICRAAGARITDNENSEPHLGGLLWSFGSTTLEWVHDGTTITATVSDDKTLHIQVGSERPMHLEGAADQLYWAILAKFGVTPPEPRQAPSPGSSARRRAAAP